MKRSKLQSLNRIKSTSKGFENGRKTLRMTLATITRNPRGRSFRKKLNLKNLVARNVKERVGS